jgi:hypothetical protein
MSTTEVKSSSSSSGTSTRPHPIESLLLKSGQGQFGGCKVCIHQQYEDHKFQYHAILDPRTNEEIHVCLNCALGYAKEQYHAKCQLYDDEKFSKLEKEIKDMNMALKVIMVHLDKFELSQTVLHKD